jgi:hypothetical protein
MKLQAILFAPVLGLTYLYWMADSKNNFKQIALAAAGAIVLQLLILTPFMLTENGIQLLWEKVVFDSFHQKDPYIGNYNFWALASLHHWKTPDYTLYIAGITYKQAGVFLFYFFSFLAMSPLLVSIYKRLRNRQATLPDRNVYWITCSLVGVLFYYFNTEMHERYSHPAWLFLTVYAFSKRDFFPYIMFSLAYFFVMENSLRFFQLNSYNTVIFNPVFISCLFAVVIIYLFYKLFKLGFQKREATVSELSPAV